MRVLLSYTLSAIRKNRHTSLSIMAAVLLSSTLLCAMCTFGYTQLMWHIEIEEYQNGQWHGELGGEISQEKLAIVDNHLYVDKTMVKGPFSYLKLSEESQLPYLILRDADENYWNLMGEKNAVIEGRPPKAQGEIVVSKSFFEQNPAYQIGDTITFPEGERRLGEEALDIAQAKREEETFCQTGEKQVTLVGSLDVTTSTSVQGYYAMGYMERESIPKGEELVVYVKFTDIRKTYELMPQIADAIGIEKDEYGKYKNHFQYHTMLLAENFVFPPEREISIEQLGGPLVYGILVLLAAGAFVMIIHGAFQVSASGRMKQLGMFRSVGATPGQIAASILMEGVILSAVPILLSIGIGYLFTVAVMGVYTNIAGEMLYFPVTVRFSPFLAFVSGCLSFLTVLTAALFPALRIAKLSPIEAIRMQEGAGGYFKQKQKPRRYFIFRRLSGPLGDLAGASHFANRRGFRASVLSLSLCLMLLTGFFTFMYLNDFLSRRNEKASYHNIYVRLDMTMETDGEFLSKVLEVPGEEDSIYYSVSRMAAWVSPEKESEAFRERGGFEELDLNRWALVKRDGKYRIRTYLYGIQDEKFDEYCRLCGCDPAEYYDTENIRALAVSSAPLYPDVVNNSQKSELSYPHLNLLEGETIVAEEKSEDDVESDYSVPIQIGKVADKELNLSDVRNNYTINFYMPLTVYYSIAGALSPDRGGHYDTYIKIKTLPEDDLEVTKQVRELCNSVMASEDVTIISRAEAEQNEAAGMRAMEAVVNCIGLLLVLIGVSNTLSAVSHAMMRRRREFAMLRSVGMDSRKVGQLLLLEGIRMALTPALIALPSVFILLSLLMKIVDVTWMEMLPFMPWGKILLSIAAVMMAVIISYLLSSGRIKKDTIIDAVRDENMG